MATPQRNLQNARVVSDQTFDATSYFNKKLGDFAKVPIMTAPVPHYGLEGNIIYDPSLDQLCYCTGVAWICLGPASGLATVSTLAPIIGNGTPGNPVRLQTPLPLPGECQILQWNATTLAWEITEPPSETTVSAGPGGMYPSVQVAINVCPFVRVVGSFAEGGVVAAPLEAIIYLDPGVSWSATSITVPVGGSLTLRGSGLDSIFTFTAPVTGGVTSKVSVRDAFVNSQGFSGFTSVDIHNASITETVNPIATGATNLRVCDSALVLNGAGAAISLNSTNVVLTDNTISGTPPATILAGYTEAYVDGIVYSGITNTIIQVLDGMFSNIILRPLTAGAITLAVGAGANRRFIVNCQVGDISNLLAPAFANLNNLFIQNIAATFFTALSIVGAATSNSISSTILDNIIVTTASVINGQFLNSSVKSLKLPVGSSFNVESSSNNLEVFDGSLGTVNFPALGVAGASTNIRFTDNLVADFTLNPASVSRLSITNLNSSGTVSINNLSAAGKEFLTIDGCFCTSFVDGVSNAGAGRQYLNITAVTASFASQDLFASNINGSTSLTILNTVLNAMMSNLKAGAGGLPTLDCSTSSISGLFASGPVNINGANNHFENLQVSAGAVNLKGSNNHFVDVTITNNNFIIADAFGAAATAINNKLTNVLVTGAGSLIVGRGTSVGLTGNANNTQLENCEVSGVGSIFIGVSGIASTGSANNCQLSNCIGIIVVASGQGTSNAQNCKIVNCDSTSLQLSNSTIPGNTNASGAQVSNCTIGTLSIASGAGTSVADKCLLSNITVTVTPTDVAGGVTQSATECLISNSKFTAVDHILNLTSIDGQCVNVQMGQPSGGAGLSTINFLPIVINRCIGLGCKINTAAFGTNPARPAIPANLVDMNFFGW